MTPDQYDDTSQSQLYFCPTSWLARLWLAWTVPASQIRYQRWP